MIEQDPWVEQDAWALKQLVAAILETAKRNPAALAPETVSDLRLARDRLSEALDIVVTPRLWVVDNG